MAGPGELIGAAGGEVLAGHDGADRRDLLAGERHHRGRLAGFERQLPALGGLDRVGALHADEAQFKGLFQCGLPGHLLNGSYRLPGLPLKAGAACTSGDDRGASCPG